jgi:hypothetical protein
VNGGSSEHFSFGLGWQESLIRGKKASQSVFNYSIGKQRVVAFLFEFVVLTVGFPGGVESSASNRPGIFDNSNSHIKWTRSFRFVLDFSQRCKSVGDFNFFNFASFTWAASKQSTRTFSTADWSSAVVASSMNRSNILRETFMRTCSMHGGMQWVASWKIGRP